MSNTRWELENIVDALDDVPLGDDVVDETVKRLGIDLGALAGRLRATLTARDRRASEERFQEARRGYAAALERLEQRPARRSDSRQARLATFRALLGKAPPNAVAMHFHKFETASDEELEELTVALEHLLDDRDG